MPLKDMPWPETRSVLRLAAPIALTQIGMVLYGTVDMLFVGRLGAGAIAADWAGGPRGCGSGWPRGWRWWRPCSGGNGACGPKG